MLVTCRPRLEHVSFSLYWKEPLHIQTSSLPDVSLDLGKPASEATREEVLAAAERGRQNMSAGRWSNCDSVDGRGVHVRKCIFLWRMLLCCSAGVAFRGNLAALGALQGPMAESNCWVGSMPHVSNRVGPAMKKGS
jgi:hypothetical protein